MAHLRPAPVRAACDPLDPLDPCAPSSADARFLILFWHKCPSSTSYMDKVGLEAGLRKFQWGVLSVINFLSLIEYSRGNNSFFVSCGWWDLLNLLFYPHIKNPTFGSKNQKYLRGPLLADEQFKIFQKKGGYLFFLTLSPSSWDIDLVWRTNRDIIRKRNHINYYYLVIQFDTPTSYSTVRVILRKYISGSECRMSVMKVTLLPCKADYITKKESLIKIPMANGDRVRCFCPNKIF